MQLFEKATNSPADIIQEDHE